MVALMLIGYNVKFFVADRHGVDVHRPAYRGWYWCGPNTMVDWVGSFKTKRECLDDMFANHEREEAWAMRTAR